jgi:lipopolysaccharide transport system ATP-binding protein
MVDAQRVLVAAHGLGKSYPKVFHRRDRLRALASLLLGRRGIDAVSVLHDVGFEVRAGESLGLIGENGAGKSTLLKLIAGVLTPTAGSVQVNGRVGALLELGAGFHPEYSGRDNIALAAALYGLSGEELRERVPGIVAFADIGDYIDEPVKHYSSGMVVRLGFAIVAALRPDLLITDEVLAVGDESFQKKCVRWMEDYLGGGGTLILVSHSMYHVQKLCRRACWLRHGAVAAYGDVYDVTQAYLAYQESKSALPAQNQRQAVQQGQEFHLLELALNGETADRTLLLDQASDLRVRVRVHSADGRVPVVGFGIGRIEGTSVYGLSSEMERVHPQRVGASEYAAEIAFPELPLLPGSYVVRAHAFDSEGVRLFDTLTRTLTVRGESREFGLVRLPHKWSQVETEAVTAERNHG